MKEITFIIPCAGKGSRLNIPGCKELLPISNGTTLIDEVFSNLKEFKDISQIILIISKDKEQLVKYVSKYSDEFNIYFVYQKTYFSDLSGAINSASEFFSKKNILILPDIILRDKNLSEKIKKYVEILEKTDCCYLITKSKNYNVLEKVGCLVINNDNVEGIIDKPSKIEIIQKNLTSYWISFGFNKNFINSYNKHFSLMQEKNKFNKLEKFPYINIDFALDLGTWENIKLYYNMLKN